MLVSTWLLFWQVSILQLQAVTAFTDYLLKTCVQSGFCHRNREYARNVQISGNSYYSIDKNSVEYNITGNVFRAAIIKTIPRLDGDDISVNLPFTLSFLPNSSSVRFTIDEVREHSASIPTTLSQMRYNGVSEWAFSQDASTFKGEATVKTNSWFNSDQISIENKDKSLKIVLSVKSFNLKIYYKGKLSMVINERSFLNVEHLRSKEDNFRNLLPEETSFNMFKDNFEYSRSDSIPFGPESVALDFTFKNFQYLYGIPEHAESLKLRDTTNGEPYRLFNVDVFEYNVGSTMPMYGAIPFMIAGSPESSSGLFWVNAADTWVDINYGGADAKTHWMSESGVIDVVLFFGRTPAEITEKYTALTGRPTLPPISSIGYHQCRWNYNDESDILNVDAEMDRAHVPYDYIWLDLEYADDKKFFTWKPNSFPKPDRLLRKLRRLGRQLVVLIDPHLKTGYEISREIINKDVEVKDCRGTTFFGHCWPGQSIWIDTFGQTGQRLWYEFLRRFVKGLTNLHIWNDMNEPSIFSGPETTAPKDLIHHGGYEERSVHNIYGLTVHESTYNSMKKIRSHEDLRPFILTRSFFAGSQRTAATWTGDNVANWDYLKISIPMCLTNNIVGMPFIGADIAGFAGDPEEELIVRWYQAGLWYPFFRAHAHIDTKRREPYLLREPVKSAVRDAIQLRYSLLPTLYSAFHKSSIDGSPIMKPMFYEKQRYEEVYSIDDQFYMGDSGLLIKPIVQSGKSEIEMMVTPGIYYDYYNFESFTIKGRKVQRKTIMADLNKIPILLEGGHVIIKKDKYRRSSKLLRNDPYTLTFAPDEHGAAYGEVYIDDGETFAFERGEYLKTALSLNDCKIMKGIPIHIPSSDGHTGNTNIEKITIALGKNGCNIKNTVTIKQGTNSHVGVVTKMNSREAVIFTPLINLSQDWEIIF